MSEVNWSDRLNHIRFSRCVLFLEKWFSVIILVLLVILKLNPIAVAVVSAIFAIHYLMTHAGHFLLEETGGMPVNRVTMRY